MPQERVAMEDALDAYTRGSAYAERMDGEKGTLAPGMLADVVVLADDIRERPHAALRTAVEMTIVGGRVVHPA